MARVPTVAERGQAVGSVGISRTTGPMQSLQTDADMFGGAQARTLQQASAAINGIAATFKQKAEDDDALVVLENDNLTTQFKLDMLHNPENGLLTRQGKNAVGMSDEAAKRFDEYAASLPQPKTAAGRLAQQEKLLKMKAAMIKTASVYERGQVEAYKTGQIEAGMANDIQEMQSLYTDPAALANGEKGLRGKASTYAKRLGMSPPAEAEYIEKQVSTGYLGAIKQADAAGNYQAAEQILNSAGDKMQPADRQVALNLVQEGKLLGNTQKIADEIMLRPGLTDTQRVAAVKEATKGDPRLRKSAEQEVMHRLDVERTMEARAREDQYRTLQERARKGEKMPTEAEMTGLDNSSKETLRAIYREAEKRKANPNYDRQDDKVAMNDFFDKFALSDPTQNLAQYETVEQLSAQYEAKVSKETFENEIRPAWAQQRLAAQKVVTDYDRKIAEEKRTAMPDVPEDQLQDAFFRATGYLSKDKAKEYAKFRQSIRRRIAASGAATPAEKFRILMQVRNEAVVYDKPGMPGVRNVPGWDTTANAMILASDPDKLVDMGSDLGYEGTARQDFVAYAPSIIDRLSLAGAPVTRDSIAISFDALSSLPAEQRAAFLVNSGQLARRLLDNGIALTSEKLVADFIAAQKQAAQKQQGASGG